MFDKKDFTKFKGCKYAVDGLFVLACNTQAGFYIADASSVLDQSNCKERCNLNNDDKVSLIYKFQD